jgi:hypothetical protein
MSRRVFAYGCEMKKALTWTFIFLTFFLVMPLYAYVVKADSNDLLIFSGGVTVLNPVNKTYTSNDLTLSVVFTGGLQPSLTFSVDGVNEGMIPLTPDYSSGITIVNAKSVGAVTLPKLSDGSHQLTIYENVYLNNFHSANPPGAPFKETPPGSYNYTASWTDTVFFSINTVTSPTPSVIATATLPASPTEQTTTFPTPAVPELSWLIILPFLLSVFAVALVLRHRKQVKKV